MPGGRLRGLCCGAAAAGALALAVAYAAGAPPFGGPAGRSAAPPRVPAGGWHPAGEPGPPRDDMPLPLPDRKYLWEIEDTAFVLDYRLFPRLAGALRGGPGQEARQTLLAEFHPGFRGRPLPLAPSRAALGGLIEESRHARGHPRAGPGPRAEVGREEFAASLLDYRRRFHRLAGVEIKSLRLEPRRKELAGSWRVRCKLRLWGELDSGRPGEVTAELDLETVSRPGREAREWIAAAAVDSAALVGGRRPGFFTADRASQRGLQPERFFDNWKRPPDLPYIPVTGGVYTADYDQDGWLDVLVTDGPRHFLYRGGRVGFSDVTAAAGLPGRLEAPENCVAFVDLDGDGREDLLFRNRVFRNRGDGTFEEVRRETGLTIPPAARGFALADYDRDGRVDLYVCMSASGPRPEGKKAGWIDNESGYRNQLWRNRGGWRFENVTERAGAAGPPGSTFAAAWLDANRDGWPDLVAVREFGRHSFFLNRGDGTFAERPLDPVFGGFGMGVSTGDVDNDGYTDVYVAAMYSRAGERILASLRPDAYDPGVYRKMQGFCTGNRLYRNTGEGFSETAAAARVNRVGWAYGSTLVDLDNDGWLDVYALAGFMSVGAEEPDG